jgi:hypothetical protein
LRRLGFGKGLRLLSTLPFPDGSKKQRRITTPITYAAGLEQARKLAEELGRDIELNRMGLDPFRFNRWLDEPKIKCWGQFGCRGDCAQQGAGFAAVPPTIAMFSPHDGSPQSQELVLIHWISAAVLRCYSSACRSHWPRCLPAQLPPFCREN